MRRHRWPSCRCPSAHPTAWATSSLTVEYGRRTQRRSLTQMAAISLLPTLTELNLESWLVWTAYLSFFVGRLTEEFFDLPCRIRREMPPRCGRLRPMEPVSTSCFPDGIIRLQSAAAIGLQTGGTTFLIRLGMAERMFGPSEKLRRSSGDQAAIRCS